MPKTAAPAPTSRRAAREAALRVLYTVDVGKQPVEEATEETFAAHTLDAPMTDFARSLISGTLRNRGDIDRAIDKFAVGFPVARQTAVDRNILRMATAEILFPVTQAPPGAVVNEAVELAKKYSTADSGKFVNGVLGAMVREQAGVRGQEPEEATGNGQRATGEIQNPKSKIQNTQSPNHPITQSPTGEDTDA